MKLLLDTQSFLWFVQADPRLSNAARTACEDGGNVVLLSIASVWEMAIKNAIGKLTFYAPLETFVRTHIADNDIDLLPISIGHAFAVASMPQHHRDPFDRLLVAQAATDRLTLVSSDVVLDRYGVARLW
jgi:PIN domain nuclease of toxin-antitoxin system